MEQPVQFVSTGESGTDLLLNDKAIQLLKDEKRPMTVVSIVGPYRTGKSYLLNRLMGKSNGFELGPTIEAKTKGIWIWKGDFPGQPNRCLVLLDVEGLSDAQKGDATHDLNLFVLALLASSIFIYNTKGTIDSTSLDGLHLAMRIGDEIIRNERDMETISQFTPDFIWAIRDYHLKLEINGESVTEKQYLEHCLSTKKGFSPKVVSYNALRDAIRNYFPNRDCFVFPPPTTDINKMNYLDQLTDDELVPEFKMAANNFVDHVKKFARSKTIKGTEISGHAFSILMENYLESLLNKNLSLQSSFSYLVNEENRRALESAFGHFRTILEDEIQEFPISTDALLRVTEKAFTEATQTFLDSCMNIESNKDFLDELKQFRKDEIEQLAKRNSFESEKKSSAALKKLYEPIEARMIEDFMVPGGYDRLKHEFDALRLKFHELLTREEFGPCKGEVLKKFEDEQMNPTIQRVLAADQQLTEMKKEEERLKLEKEQKEKEAKRFEEEAQQLREHQEKLQHIHEKNVMQIQETFKKQHEQEMKQIQTQMENEKAEMNRMQELNKREMAKHHESTIKFLEKQVEVAKENHDREIRMQQARMKESGDSWMNIIPPIVKGVVSLVKHFNPRGPSPTKK